MVSLSSLQFIIGATKKTYFFVSFSLEWQCFIFYTGAERTHLEQLGNGQWISLENESIARQMVKWTLTSYLEHRLRHLFFVSFSLESQCLMFYTYFYTCKWTITSGITNASVAGQMVKYANKYSRMLFFSQRSSWFTFIFDQMQFFGRT